MALRKSINPTENKKAHLIIRRIASQFPDSFHGRLMLGIVGRALLDSIENGLDYEAHNARDYINGTMHHAELCGVDSEWIRRVVRKIGLNYSIMRQGVIVQTLPVVE